MMKTKYLKVFISTFALSLLMVGGLNQDTFGQGKGHGKGGGGGNPKGGPPPQQQRGGGDQQRGNGGWKQQQRQQPPPQQVYRQQAPRQEYRQQQQQPQAQRVYRQQAPQQVYRQPQQQQVFRQSPGQARKQERVFRQQAPQQVYRQQAPQQVWRQQRQQQQQQQQAYRMPPGQAKKQQRQQQAYIPAPFYQDQGRGNGRGRGKQDRQFDATPWNGGGRVPPGQIRSAEVHQRNAIRKAEREQERFYQQYRRDERSYRDGGRFYQQPYYAPYVPAPVYQYQQPYSNYSYGYSQPYYPSYQYYEQQYSDPYSYYGGGYLANSPLYVPNAYIYEPYTAYATYPEYYGYSQPYYGYDNGGFDWKSMLVRTLIGFVLGNDNNDYYGQQPYDPYYGYTPALYNSNDSYAPYGGDYYPTSYSNIDYYQPVYEYGGYDVPLVNTIPMQDLFGPSYGGYASETLREVLGQGYEQGYQAGYYARDNQLRNSYYTTDYSIDSGYLDPYSYSIGENRRCFSEGYSIGYQDAMNGRQDYISQYSGNTDLLSLLLSNVIGNA